MTKNNISYSIVVLTYNAEAYVPDLISVLRSKKDKVYIIDSTSTDDTLNCFKSEGFKNIYTIPTVDFDHGGTRRMAGKLCTTDVVVFLTQDALPFSIDDIQKLVDVFDEKNIAAAYGRQIPYPDTNVFGQHLREFNYSECPYVRSFEDKNMFGLKTAFLSNSFSAYRCSAMNEIDWFKDALILGEDAYAGAKLLQAGYKLAYVANACVYHSHSYTIIEEFKRYFDIGVFHKMESWMLDDFGKPQGEGLRYIKSEFSYLVKQKAYIDFPEFVVRNGMKYLGYKMGMNFKKLPKKMILNFSMHSRWWNKFWRN